MQITSLNKQENTIGLYVDDLVDLKLLFDQLSPSVKDLLDDCFVKTNRCANILNADWASGTTFKVFNQHSSLIDERMANNAITDNNPGSGPGTDR